MKALKLGLVVACCVPVAAHAASERRAEIDARREMGALANVAVAVPFAAHVVHLNGAELYFDKHTERGSVDDVMARVAKQCAAGDLGNGDGDGNTKPEGDGKREPVPFERVVSQEAENGARASLCVFEGHRVRWTLAFRRGDGTTAVTTVVNASSIPIEQLWPAEGDSPGSDLEGVARPAEARRIATIFVGKGEHSVRVYDSALSVGGAVQSYDRQMTARGFATTGALDDARIYRKDGRSFVASFRGTTHGSTVAIMPSERLLLSDREAALLTSRDRREKPSKIQRHTACKPRLRCEPP